MRQSQSKPGSRFTSKDAVRSLRNVSSPRVAEISARFFKTGKGEYGEGDQFIGVRAADLRKVADTYRSLGLPEIQKLVRSKIHEERLLALVILTLKYEEADSGLRTAIYRFYLKNIRFVNNWDLVDSSAHLIVGPHLEKRDRKILVRLARSKILWERRVAVLSTYHFIRQNEFEYALSLYTLLVRDPEDLIQKAVGWMLREIGKRDLESETGFLDLHAETMPRTMLRYAIERFPEPKRQAYLRKRSSEPKRARSKA